MQKLIYFFNLRLSLDNPFDPKSMPKLLKLGPKSYTLPLFFDQLSLKINIIIVIIVYSKILECLSNCLFSLLVDNKHSIKTSCLSSWGEHDSETIFSRLVFFHYVIDILSLFGQRRHQGHSPTHKCIFSLR